MQQEIGGIEIGLVVGIQHAHCGNAQGYVFYGIKADMDDGSLHRGDFLG